MVGFSAFAIGLNCLTVLAVFGWAMWVAPARFHLVSFRRRWKFMIQKMRPSVHWWMMVILIKGLWLALTSVLWNTTMAQSLWICTGLLAYFTGSYVLLPWRSVFVAMLDIGTHVSILLLCLLLPFLLTFKPEESDVASMFFLILSGLCFLAVVTSLLWILYKVLGLWFYVKAALRTWHRQLRYMFRHVIGMSVFAMMGRSPDLTPNPVGSSERTKGIRMQSSSAIALIAELRTPGPWGRFAMASGSFLGGLRFSRFLADEDAAGQGFSTTEGRFGVTRFNGDSSRLNEWTFRVRALERKEAAMTALKVAQTFDIKKLEKNGGGHTTLMPRAWCRAMTDLNAELKLPDLILAEQLLNNVAEELIAQHPRIHECAQGHPGLSLENTEDIQEFTEVLWLCRRGKWTHNDDDEPQHDLEYPDDEAYGYMGYADGDEDSGHHEIGTLRRSIWRTWSREAYFAGKAARQKGHSGFQKLQLELSQAPSEKRAKLQAQKARTTMAMERGMVLPRARQALLLLRQRGKQRAKNLAWSPSPYQRPRLPEPTMRNLLYDMIHNNREDHLHYPTVPSILKMRGECRRDGAWTVDDDWKQLMETLWASPMR
ncbi:unnamed protein product [Symbiodinium necroappetens]|uniref:Uncharacterized protein n=1 Tax=Symbiodinium necroappetens TaxID=1628268 RepID=A0A812PQB8_9DINO|nr:unnamed protein product [Symbiodinium necroappetens]